MSFGWEEPQEDEFAMVLLGQPSTYAEIAWPNRPGGAVPLCLSHLSPRARRDWCRAFVHFLKLVSYMDAQSTGRPPRQLVLKSPPHTARIPLLLSIFPKAKFAFLKRDPYVLYSSTLKLWQSFARKHGLQTPARDDLLQAKVLSEFKHLHACYDRDKHMIPPGHLVEVRYEDLAADLVGQTARVYESLNLPGWDAARAHVQQSADARKTYQPNRHAIDASVQAIVDEHWGEQIRAWGYAQSRTAAAVPT
jgi:omega-hydroxy-beta-dihydromenaquinone-9 sulfotransferase